MCFRDRSASFFPSPTGLKTRTRVAPGRSFSLAAFKTRFGDRGVPRRKGVFVENFKAHNYETSARAVPRGRSNISLSTIGNYRPRVRRRVRQ